MKAKTLYMSAALFAVMFCISTVLSPASLAAPLAAQNLYPWGQCTYYAKMVRPDIPNRLGNARYWTAGARAAGFPVDQKPRVGDVAVLQPYVQGNSKYGHVGIVTKVDGKRFLLASWWGSEANGRLHHVWHTVASGVSFIHKKSK